MDDGTSAAPGGHAFAAGAGQNGVYQQLGPIHYGEEGGGNEGCLTSQVGNARTYRLPDDVNTSLFGDVQQYPQDVLDQKPMQCTTFYMFAAFCIWDGGRIPTLGELDSAWDGGDPDGHLYPWGNAPAPGGWDHPYPFMPDGTFGVHAPEGSDITFANYRYNFWMPAQMTCLGDDANKCDYSLYLAPPGRFPKGNGPFGHADLAGDVYNVAMPPDDVDAGSDPATMQAGLERTGAFDKHAIPKARPVAGFRTYTATNKYLARRGTLRPMILTSALLQNAGFSHGFTTRATGDFARGQPLRTDVLPTPLFLAAQVHGVVVHDVGADADVAAVAAFQADALITRAAVAIGIRVADCVPVLLADPSGGVAAVHAGWRGLAGGIARAALSRLDAAAEHVLVALGPSIGPCCFEVDRLTAETIAASSSDACVHPAPDPNQRATHAQVDLRTALETQLAALGVPAHHVERVGGCSRCDPVGLHSHRRDGAGSGRMLGFVVGR